jgi:hypothetical protein
MPEPLPSEVIVTLTYPEGQVIEHWTGEQWQARRNLLDAAIYSADRSGLGSDEVWEIARKIKGMQQEANNV